jgi:hypothetical protein
MIASSTARLTVVQPDSREVTLVPGFTATVKLAATPSTRESWSRLIAIPAKTRSRV